MGIKKEKGTKNQSAWSPHAPPPAGVRLDNLRRRGIDLLRFHLHAPHRTGHFVRAMMTLAMVPFIAWCIYENWLAFMLIVLFVMAIVSQQFEPSKLDGNWTISLTPNAMSIDRNKGEEKAETIINIEPTDIKSIDIRKFKTNGRHYLRVSSAGDKVDFGAGLSKEALVWLKNYLIMEISGRAWRPLYNVDRSVTRTNKTEAAANPTLMGQDLAMRLIDIYRNEAPGFIEQLGEAVENQDAVGIRQNAHWLKSASAHVGAKYMSESCQVMQIYGMDNDLSRTEVLFEEIKRTNEDLMRWLSEVSDVSTMAVMQAPPAQNVPLRRDAPLELGATAKNARDAEGAVSREMKILVIDDSAVSREIARNFLSDLANELVFANDGQAAIDLCGSDKFDLILTDCEMFGMDGYEFARKFREIEIETGAERTPVVALTAHALKGDRARCLDAGMDDYLSKPYTVEELHKKIEQWLNPREASYLSLIHI